MHWDVHQAHHAWLSSAFDADSHLQCVRVAVMRDGDSMETTGLGAAQGGAGALHGAERLLQTQPDNEGPAHWSGGLRSIFKTMRNDAKLPRSSSAVMLQELEKRTVSPFPGRASLLAAP